MTCREFKMVDDLTMTIPVENSRSAVLRVIVEPWAFEVLLQSRERCEVVFAGPLREPSLEVGDDWLAVWAWDGCTTWVTKNGQIVQDCRQGPRVPSGLETLKPFFKRLPPYSEDG